MNPRRQISDKTLKLQSLTWQGYAYLQKHKNNTAVVKNHQIFRLYEIMQTSEEIIFL